jgi:4-diphosphocytidyl-2-C-methyl-D-erythritol kinase
MSIYYKISAPAKLNLNLFIKDKKCKQLHFLESEMCFLELRDNIYFKFSKNDKFNQNKSSSFIINPKDNLVLNAVKKFRLFTNWKQNFEIFLDKKIPIGAGLGGGSADAAATLILLRNLFNKENKYNKISFSDIYEIGSLLGSDIPACLISKDLKLKGYAKEIKRIKVPSNYYFLIINPNVELYTKDVFKNFSNFSEMKDKPNIIFFENIKIYNSLLLSAIRLTPQISDVLEKLNKIPDIVAYGMSGSGSTCFGIFKNLNDISRSIKIFSKNYFIWYGKKSNYNINRVCSSKMLEIKF